MDKVVQAATVIAAFFFLLGVFHGPHQVHHELLCDTFDTIRVLTIYSFILTGTLLFHMCQAYSSHFNQILTSAGGRNLSTWVWLYYQWYGLGRVPWSLPFWLPMWLANSQSTSPVGWPSGRPPWP